MPLVKNLWLAGALLASSAALCAQTAPAVPATAPERQNPSTQTPAEPVLPPKPPEELFKDAMHPLDAVRASLDNWSDAELGALAVGMRMAAQDCAQTKPELYQGNDLYALARLCAFGQDWEGANGAALAYVARHEDEHRAQAYAISVSALVHMGATDLAVQTAREMLSRLPYDAEVAYAMRDLKNDLVQASNPDALALAESEHPLIVAALKQGVALRAAHGDAVIRSGVLYESAMQLAFLERFSGNDAAAANDAAETQAALPASVSLSAEDRQRRDAIDTRYRLLGMHLPPVKVLRALESPAAKAQIDLSFASASVLVLFPDWCVACRKMLKTLTEFAVVNRDTPIRAYGMVFADDSVVSGKAAHDENFKQLAGTQTLEVNDAAAQTFGATDYPLGIVLDNTRTIRFIGLLPSNAFNGDGYISKVIVNMTKLARGAQERTQN
jgi:thiol-disulfide isomerase/thioredoxin